MGAAIETPRASARLVWKAQTRADDAMDLLRVNTLGAGSRAPAERRSVLMEMPAKRRQILKDLRKAPLASLMTDLRCCADESVAVFV